MSFTLHWLVPDANGPNVSGPGGTTLKIGRVAQHAIACNGNLKVSEEHRGTTEAWLVVCAACKATAAYKALPEEKRKRPERAEEEDDYAKP